MSHFYLYLNQGVFGPGQVVNHLPTSASVFDIFAASGSSGHFPKEVIKCQELHCLLCDVYFFYLFLKVSLDLVNHLTTSASVFDILAASGSGHFPEEVIKCHIISCVMFHF